MLERVSSLPYTGVVEVEWRRAAAYVVCRDSLDRLLLTRFVSDSHPDSGMWTMPGGGMEWGESPSDTALRELREETGLSAALGPVLGVYSQWFTASESVRGQAGHVLGLVFATSSVGGDLRTEFDAGTTDAARWFDLDEVGRLPRVGLVDFVLGLLQTNEHLPATEHLVPGSNPNPDSG